MTIVVIDERGERLPEFRLVSLPEIGETLEVWDGGKRLLVEVVSVELDTCGGDAVGPPTVVVQRRVGCWP